MNVELSPVEERHKSVLANLLQLYLHDLSEYGGHELTPHAAFGYRFLDHYFIEEAREACFVTAEGRLAGFALTRRLDDGARQVAEFFILRGHRRTGLGRAAAHRMFHRHPGEWELVFDHANRAAARFWPATVAAVAAGPVVGIDRYPPEVVLPATRLRFHIQAVPE